MHTKLRLRGSSLLSGNTGLLILTLITAIVVVFSANLSVLLYELSFKIKVEETAKEYAGLMNFGFSFLFLLFSFSVCSSINLGIHRFFLRRAQKKGGTAGDIFYYFHPLRAFGAFSFSFKMVFLRTAILLFSFLPFALCLVMLYQLLKSNVSLVVAAILGGGCAAFFISGLLFYKNITLSFFLTKYYFIDGRYISFSHLLASSQTDMKSKGRNLKKLKLSFSGWFLLCLLLLPIGYVWSYYNQTMAVAASSFMKN